jgi:hypothetical protein
MDKSFKNSDSVLFPSCWAELARDEIETLRAIDADYEPQAQTSRTAPMRVIPARADHLRARRAVEVRFTRSHDRMSAFILRDLTSNADETASS